MARLTTLWEDKLKTIFNSKPKEEEELFLDIVSMMIFNSQKDDVSTLYNELGLESFTRLLGVLGGSTITLPTQDELKHGVLSALCFYYKNIKKKSWEEIHHLLPFNDMNTISYGIAISKLEKDISDRISNNFKDIETKNKNAIEELRSYL